MTNRLLLIAIMAIPFASCNPAKKLADALPLPNLPQIVRDTVRQETRIVVRDTMRVILPGQEIVVHDTAYFPCPPGLPDTIYAVKTLTKRVKCPPDTLRVFFSHTDTVRLVAPCPPLPPAAPTSWWPALVALILGLLGGRFTKKAKPKSIALASATLLCPLFLSAQGDYDWRVFTSRLISIETVEGKSDTSEMTVYRVWEKRGATLTMTSLVNSADETTYNMRYVGVNRETGCPAFVYENLSGGTMASAQIFADPAKPLIFLESERYRLIYRR